jgi:serine protease Do
MARTSAAIWVLAALWLALPARAQQTSVADDAAAVAALQRTVVDVVARTEPSVVAVSRSSTSPSSQDLLGTTDLFGDLRPLAPGATGPTVTGAGVVIDPSGLVLTEYLAVREGDQHTVTTVGGKSYPASIKAADPRSGLAVLAIDRQALAGGSLTPVRFGDAAELRKGQFVIAIGNPYAIRTDGQATVSLGVVSNVARKAPPGANLNDVPGPLGDYRTTLHHLGTLIQTDARLGWSAGGGALVNLQGEMVGLTTTVAAIAGHERPAGYAIPINAPLRRIIDVLRQGREVEYGLLGVSFAIRHTDRGKEPDGVTVEQVYPGSPAARAGLQPGDVIMQVDGQRTADVDAIQLAVGLLPPAANATIRYARRSRAATAEVRLAKLAVPGKKIVTNRPPGWRGIHVDYATALDVVTLAQEAASGALDPQGCVLVTEVEPDSPAWQAGVRPGMFISHVGAKRVTTPDEFRAAVKDAAGTLNIRLTQPRESPDQPAAPERPIPPKE